MAMDVREKLVELLTEFMEANDNQRISDCCVADSTDGEVFKKRPFA